MKAAKSLLALVLIFVLGGVTGALISNIAAKKDMARLVDSGRAGFRALTVQRMSEQLALSPDQTKQLAEIMDRSSARVREARLPVFPQVKVALEKTEAEIRAILTPEQLAKFEPIAAEGRSRIDQYGQPAQ
jgi:Spy/CpxP family protein refolding chaperone